MKKLLALVLALILTISLCACSQSGGYELKAGAKKLNYGDKTTLDEFMKSFPDAEELGPGRYRINDGNAVIGFRFVDEDVVMVSGYSLLAGRLGDFKIGDDKEKIEKAFKDIEFDFSIPNVEVFFVDGEIMSRSDFSDKEIEVIKTHDTEKINELRNKTLLISFRLDGDKIKQIFYGDYRFVIMGR